MFFFILQLQQYKLGRLMSSNDDGKPKENGAQDESKPINAAIEGPHPTIIKVPQKVLILLSTVNFS